MPARASYEAKIEGVVSGSRSANGSAIAEFRKIFPEEAPQGIGELGGAGKFPEGFVLREYGGCLWESDGYDYGNNTTLLSFRAEISFFASGAIYDASIQTRLLNDVTWFYKYRDQGWYKDLYYRLNDPADGLNAKLKKLAQVIETVRFREWKWYCGNGGGT